MSFSERARLILSYPLVTLAGGSLTLASIVTAVLIVVMARVLAGLAARTTTRLLHQRGVADGPRFAAAKIVRYLLTFIGVLIAITSVGLRLDALFAASAVLLVG